MANITEPLDSQNGALVFTAHAHRGTLGQGLFENIEGGSNFDSGALAFGTKNGVGDVLNDESAGSFDACVKGGFSAVRRERERCAGRNRNLLRRRRLAGRENVDHIGVEIDDDDIFGSVDLQRVGRTDN